MEPMTALELWGPTIVTVVIGLLMSVFAYFYTSKEKDRSDKLTDLIEANGEVAGAQVKSQLEMVRGLHELSTAVSLLKQAFEHITVDAERKHVELLSHLNRHEDELQKLRERLHGMSNEVNVLKIKSQYKIS